MDLFDDEDFGLAGLTQESNMENSVPNFDLGYSFIEDDILVENVVSLEEGESDSHGSILYDNVRVEDISSDEEIDKM